MSLPTFEAVFQTTREINATRIKDQLYIFTGTYPIFYKGDGELYMFPEHRPSFNELVQLGDNTLMGEFENYYFSREFKELPKTTRASDFFTFRVKDFDVKPTIPYERKEENEVDPQLEILTAFELPNNPSYSNDFERFLPSDYDGQFDSIANMNDFGTENKIYYITQVENFYRRGNGSPGTEQLIFPSISLGFQNYFQIDVDVFYRATLGTERDFIKLNSSDVSFDVISNKATSQTTFNLVAGSRTLPENNQTFKGIGLNIPPFNTKVDIENIPAGLRDVRIVFKIIQKGYSFEPRNPDVGDFRPIAAFIESDVRNISIQLDELTITAEKFSNFPTEDNPTRGFFLRDAWTANKVKEHFGRLLIYGTVNRPETLYISTNEQLNYFPYQYITSFDNDLAEGINSITPYMNILVVQTDSYTWGMKGKNPKDFLDDIAEVTNPERYEVFSINTAVGNVAPRAVRPVKNRLYFLSQEGLMELTSLFATDDRYNVRFLDRNIENLIKQDKKATAIQFDDQFWINFPSTGETFRYYIEKEAWVRDTFDFNVFNGIYRYYNKNGVLHFITQPMSLDGQNFAIYEGVVDESIVTDFNQPITTQFLTSKLNQEFPFHHKKYKELKLDFSIQNEFLPTFEPVEKFAELYTETNNVYSLTFEVDELKKHGAYRISFDFGLKEPE